MKFRARRIAIGGAAFAVLAAALVALLLVTAGIAKAKQFATLKVFQQGVAVKSLGGSAFQSARDGQTVRQGDVIKTDASGRANITYFDGSQTRLDRNTTFRVEELSTIQNQARSKVIQTGLDKGKTFNRVVKLTGSESRFETETPTATASVRGTQFVLIVAPGNDLCPGTAVCRLQVTTVEVLDGVVAMLTDNGVILVKEGEKVTIFSDGTAGPVEDLTPADVNDPFVAFNQCDVDNQDLARCGGGQPPPPPPPGNRGPTASLAASTENGQAPLTVRFTDASTDPDGDTLSRVWNFGDGSSSTAGPTVNHTYSQAGDFPVTLTVKDPGGKSDSIGTVIHVTGDNTPPDTQITSSPRNATNSTTANYSFVSTEGGSSFACSFDGSGFAPCTSPFQRSGLADGQHTFAVRATDPNGNTDPTPASDSFVVDTKAPPQPEFVSTPGNPSSSKSARFAFRRGSAGQTRVTAAGMFAAVSASSGTLEHFECGLDDAAFVTCSSPEIVTVGAGGHVFRLRAVDEAGNTSLARHFAWEVNLAGPDITITRRPPDPTKKTSAKISFRVDPDNSDVTCKLDDQAAHACSSPAGFGNLSEGPHAVVVQARDQAGNVRSKTVSWRVDLTPPQTTITEGPPAESQVGDATFRFKSNGDGATFECSRDEGGFTPCSSPKAFSDLGEGGHVFAVRATDPAGNTDPSPASRNWNIAFPQVAGPFQITLSWSSGPSDLDLHVQTPDFRSEDGGEVWSGNPSHPADGSEGDWARIDHDGKSVNGEQAHETITVSPRDSGQFFDGTYHIWVENFSCDETLGSGNARVTIGQDDQILATFNIGSAAGAPAGDTWIVANAGVTPKGDVSPSSRQVIDGDECGNSGIEGLGNAIVGNAESPGSPTTDPDTTQTPDATDGGSGTDPSTGPTDDGTTGTGDGGSTGGSSGGSDGGGPTPEPTQSPPPPEPSPTEPSPEASPSDTQATAPVAADVVDSPNGGA
jgi:PKD repeat protein